MADASVQIFDDGSGTWEDIDYQRYQIDLGVSDEIAVPQAEVRTNARADVAVGDDLRVVIDGTPRFEGVIREAPYGPQGQRTLTVKHRVTGFFRDSVSFDVADRFAEGHLSQARLNAENGDDFTITFNGTNEVFEYGGFDDRSVLRIFRDVVDESNQIFRVDPVANEIFVETRGQRGQWTSFDTGDISGPDPNKITIQSWDPGNAETVINKVTVNGTGGVNVTGTARDQTSIDTWGVRSRTYNIEGLYSAGEATSYANAFLQPDPLASGQLEIPETGAADVFADRANQTVEVTDANRDINAASVNVSKQRIEPGRVTVWGGEGGQGFSSRETTRNSISTADTTRPGSVMDTDRIGELSITETKIEDGSVSTPKVKTEAITANKIETNTITANQIAADTLTADEIDALDLTTEQFTVTGDNVNTSIVFEEDTTTTPDELIIRPDGFANLRIGTLSDPVATEIVSGVSPPADNSGQVGNTSRGYSAVYAYNFIDADTGNAINDGGDVLAGLADGHGPPDYCAERDDDGEIAGYSLNDMARSVWDVVRAQQERIEDLEDRLAAVEQQLSDSGGNEHP